MTQDELYYLLLDIAEGAGFLHSQGFTHGALKPCESIA